MTFNSSPQSKGLAASLSMSWLFLFSLAAFVALPARVSAFQLGLLTHHQTRCSGYYHGSRVTSTPLFAVVDINENAPRDIQTMQEWADACGVQQAPGFQLVGENVDGDQLDVSVMTSEDLPANSPVLFIPSQMILSSNKAIDEFGRLDDAEKLLQTSNAESEVRHFYLMLQILVEWERGEDSPWFPYFNSLPRYFSTGASMTPFCYKCLPPLVATLAKKERANLNHLSSVKRMIPFLSNDTKGNAELWKWAFNIVYTRSFEINNDLCIAPMADMFNHGADETEIEFALDEEGNCYAQTTRDVPAGSPLRRSYGDPTNPSFLFARYGFLDETSPATFCKITPSHVNDEMRGLGYAHNRMLFYKDTGDVSPEVWDILLYQILTASGDDAKRRELYEAHVNGDYETKQALHQQYYPETAAKLLEHIDTFLDQLDELSGKAYGRDVSDHPRLPLILRHNEFVRNTFLAVRARYYE